MPNAGEPYIQQIQNQGAVNELPLGLIQKAESWECPRALLGGGSRNLIMRSGRCQLRVQRRLGLGAGELPRNGEWDWRVGSAETSLGPGGSVWAPRVPKQKLAGPIRS